MVVFGRTIVSLRSEGSFPFAEGKAAGGKLLRYLLRSVASMSSMQAMHDLH